ncbi:MAG: TetR/AcrR family transcriptional regulator [Spirochaetota bacterium]
MLGRRPKSIQKNSKELILGAAVTAFAKLGFYGTSIRSIAKTSGCKQPTIYHFFGNKENLFWVSLRVTHLTFKRRMLQQLQNKSSLQEELVAIVNGILQIHEKEPQGINLLFKLIYTSPPDIQKKYAEQYAKDFEQIIERTFLRYQEKNGLKRSLFTHSLYSLVLQLSTVGSYQLQGHSVEEFIEYIVLRNE